MVVTLFDYRHDIDIRLILETQPRSLSENTKFNFQTTIYGIKRHSITQYDVV